MRIVRILLFILILPLQAYSGTIHAIIVADTRAHNLEDTVYRNVENVRDQLVRISHHTQMPIKETLIRGKTLNAETLTQNLQALEVKDDDVIFFYFTGHGNRRKKSAINPWPNLHITQSREDIDFAEIVATLLEKKPRLVIAIAESCNNLGKSINAPNAHTPPPDEYQARVPLRDSHQVRERYKQLFQKSHGLVIATSATAGEISWGCPIGSYYTHALLYQLQAPQAVNKEITWTDILDHAADTVAGAEHPHYQYIPTIEEALHFRVGSYELASFKR